MSESSDKASAQLKSVADESLRLAEAVTPGAGDEIAAALLAIESEQAKAEAGDETPAEEIAAEGGGEVSEAKSEEGGAGEELVSKQWAAIKRAEKRNIRDRDEIKRQLREISAAQDEIKSIREQFKQDPIKALEAMGYTYNDITERVLNDGKPGDGESKRRLEDRSRAELEELRKEVQSTRQYITQAEQQKLINQYQSEINEALASEEFELLSAYPDAASEVLEFASIYAKTNNEVLTAREAASRIQDDLRNRLQAMASHKAVRSILAVDSPESSDKRDNGKKSQVGGKPRTLTNNLAAMPARETQAEEPLSEWEQIQAAARLIGPDAWG